MAAAWCPPLQHEHATVRHVQRNKAALGSLETEMGAASAQKTSHGTHVASPIQAGARNDSLAVDASARPRGKQVLSMRQEPGRSRFTPSNGCFCGATVANAAAATQPRHRDSATHLSTPTRRHGGTQALIVQGHATPLFGLHCTESKT